MHVLPRSRFPAVLPHVATVPFNANFAEAVVRGDVTGSVLVDDLDAPRAHLIAHPCGMSLLVGEPRSPDAEAALAGYLTNRRGTRTRPELLQVYPDSYVTRIRTLLDGCLVPGRAGEAEGPKALPAGAVIEWVRLNYRLSPGRFHARVPRPLPEGYRIERLGGGSFDGWSGALMPPRCFWDTAADFARRGTAWAVMHGEGIASLAFSAFVFGDRLEIGIETHVAHQGRGLATHACAAFIDDCLARGLEPVWSCRQGNLGSERTARAVGFEETLRIPYFALVHCRADATVS